MSVRRVFHSGTYCIYDNGEGSAVCMTMVPARPFSEENVYAVAEETYSVEAPNENIMVLTFQSRVTQ